MSNLNISISLNINIQISGELGSEGGYVTSQTCQYIMGNKCPAACGSSWEVPVNGAFAVDPAVTVTCKGTCFTDF